MGASKLSYGGITDTVKPSNEDAFGWYDSTFWVIDGATAIATDANDDVAQFVQLLNGTLIGTTAEMSRQPLQLLVRESHLVTLQNWRRLRGLRAAVPTASIIIGRADVSELEFYSLGDCNAYVRTENGSVIEVMDPQYLGKEETILQAITDATKNGITHSEAYDLYKAALLRDREKRNTPNGLWILGDHLEATEHGNYEVVQLGPLGLFDFVLMSDGYRRAYNCYRAYESKGQFVTAILKDPGEPIRKIRAAELEDPLRLRFARLSAQDDATAVCVSRTRNQAVTHRRDS